MEDPDHPTRRSHRQPTRTGPHPRSRRAAYPGWSLVSSRVLSRKELLLERLTYTVTEVAELLGISRTSAYECVRRGEIPAVMLGHRLVISRVAIERLLDSPTNAPSTASR